MLFAMIREKNKKVIDYYIEKEKKENIDYYSMIRITEDEISSMKRQEAFNLMTRVFQSKLTFLEKIKGYDVYLDENNNKRYFKDAREDFSLFFETNGTPATLYNKESGESRESVKTFLLKHHGVEFILTATITLGGLLKAIDYSQERNLSVYWAGNTIVSAYADIGTFVTGNEEITVEEAQDYILDSNGKNMTDEKKEYLANKDFITDALTFSKKGRSYLLRKKLKDIDISYFTGKELKENEDLMGYYRCLELNKIHLKDNTKEIFDNSAAHEFVHLMQDENEYIYLREASAEIMSSEYFNTRAISYPEARARLYVLMEMIGPEPIMEVNFKGDTAHFEEIIKSHLEKEDAKELLYLFTKSPLYSEDIEEVNHKIDVMLARMYKNINQEEMGADELIMDLYKTKQAKTKDRNRIYFNQNKKEFFKPYYEYDTEVIGLKEALKEKKIKKFIYEYDERILEEEYLNRLENNDENVYVEGFTNNKEYFREYNILLDGDKKYETVEEARKKKKIMGWGYHKTGKIYFDNLEKLITYHQEHQDERFDVEAEGNDGEIWELITEKDDVDMDSSREEMLENLYFIREEKRKIISIAQKFPHQVRKRKQNSELSSMLETEEKEKTEERTEKRI